MSEETCVICGAVIPEGRQVCPNCEFLKSLSPYEEIIKAMFDKTPVEHRGIKYGCISAFVIRNRTHINRSLEKPILQVELMSGRTASVTMADPKEVIILKDFKKEARE